MDVKQFIDSVTLMLVLFNPLLMSAYLHDVMNQLSRRDFLAVVGKAFVISGVVFMIFAAAGDQLFSRVLQVRFSAFLIFGGIVFMIIALRYFISGAEMIGKLRGAKEHLAGTIAMPFMIGPGTISASVLIGSKLPLWIAGVAIVIALLVSCLLLVAIKCLFDFVHKKNEGLVERYVEIIGRASALLMGTIAVEMILKGLDLWLQERGTQ